MTDKKSIRDLLYRIATDPDFRDQLIADPVGVMGAAGIQIDPVKDIPAGGITLPSSAEILRNLESWAEEIFNPRSPPQNNAPRIWLGLS
jgi:hypothetical protein